MASPDSLKILLVEDHDALREVTREALQHRGHRVAAFDSAEAALEDGAATDADIALLDLNLPGEDGLSLARRLRRGRPGMGIVMLTVRQQPGDRVRGYEDGADIYLAKPTDADELGAAIASLGRRLRPAGAAADCWLDAGARSLVTARGALPLREPELRILQALALAPDRLLPAWQLLEVLGKPCDEPGRAQLEVLVSRLRKRLVQHGLPERPIRGERGVGYRLCVPLQLR